MQVEQSPLDSDTGVAGVSDLFRFWRALRRTPVAIWILLFAVLVSLFLLRQRGELSRVGTVLRTADVRWVLLLAVGSVLVQLLFALKQAQLLRLLGHRVPTTAVAEAQLQRQALATVVPVAGVSAAYVLVRRIGRYGVPIDDIMLALVLFSVLGHASFAAYLLPTLAWLATQGGINAAILSGTAVLVTVALGLITLLAHLVRGGHLPAWLERRLHARVGQFLDEARRHGIRLGGLVVPFLFALAGDLSGVALLWVSLRALGEHPSVGMAAGGYAVGTLFLMLAPVFQGLGVVELSMAIALERLGVPKASAVAATLLYRVAELWLPLTLGAAVTARGSGRIRGLPAHVPAITTALTGLLSIAVVLAPTISRRYDRLEDYALLDPFDGGRTLAVVIGFVLLFLSYSLWRRRRVAWFAAVALSAAAVVTHIAKRHDEIVTLVAAGNLGLLLLYRRRFRVRADVPTMRRGLIGFVSCLAGAMAYGTLGFWLVDERAFGVEFSFPASVARTLRLFFNLGDAGLEPRTRYADWFLDSVSIVGVIAVVGAVLAIGRPIVWRRRMRPQERAAAAKLIERYGDSSLDFFKTWPDKLFFFSSTGDGLVAYGMTAATAVALGDPVAADHAAFTRVLQEFIDFCDANGWRVAFHQTSPHRRSAYQAAGLTVLKIGEEAVVDVERFSLAGHAMKGLRAALNRLQREGYTATYVMPPLAPDLVAELRAVSDNWLDLPGRRERGFTVGTFDDGYVAGTPVMHLTGPDGRVVAFVNLVPDGVADEATIDLMRHRAAAPNGAMDAVFAQLLLHLRDQGYRRFSLGMAPWAEVGTSTDAPFRERVLGALAQHLDHFFSDEGLRAYKDKFRPIWEPRFLVYDGDAALPQVALAIVRLTEQSDGVEFVAPVAHPAMALDVPS